ncbi:MAG: hypothetical protein WCH60_15175 [Burkholderiales bacterium]
MLLVEGAFAWIKLIDGITEKSVFVWQEVQVALADVGIWLLGFAAVVKLVVLAWQFEQSPPTGCAPSVTL